MVLVNDANKGFVRYSSNIKEYLTNGDGVMTSPRALPVLLSKDDILNDAFPIHHHMHHAGLHNARNKFHVFP